MTSCGLSSHQPIFGQYFGRTNQFHAIIIPYNSWQTINRTKTLNSINSAIIHIVEQPATEYQANTTLCNTTATTQKMNNHTHSSSLDSEIWSSSPHMHHSSQNYDAWNILQRPSVLGASTSPSKLSWEDVGTFSQRKKELALDHVQEPTPQTTQQIISPNNGNDHDLVRSLDQLLLEEEEEVDDGDIFEFDMGADANYYSPAIGRPPYRRRQPCKFFQNNNCKAGSKCRFSHDMSPPQQQQVSMSPMRTSSLSSSPHMNTPPPRQFTGASPVQSTPYILASNGIKYCRFNLSGFCRNGDNCPYAHEQDAYSSLFQTPNQHQYYQSPMLSSLPDDSYGTSPPLSDSSTSDDNNPKVCPFFLKGDCRYGDRCRNMHVRLTPNVSNKKKLINEESLEKFSKIPCKYYRQGHCPFGDACYYLHRIDDQQQYYMYQNNIPNMYQEDQAQYM